MTLQRWTWLLVVALQLAVAGPAAGQAAGPAELAGLEDCLLLGFAGGLAAALLLLVGLLRECFESPE